MNNDQTMAKLIDLQERVAAAMWKAEAMRAAPNVGRNRTLEAFRDSAGEERAKWLGLASAALTEILD